MGGVGGHREKPFDFNRPAETVKSLSTSIGRRKNPENSIFFPTELSWPYSQSMRDFLPNGGVERSGNGLEGHFPKVQKLEGVYKIGGWSSGGLPAPRPFAEPGGLRPPDSLRSPGGCAPRTPCGAQGGAPPGPPAEPGGLRPPDPPVGDQHLVGDHVEKSRKITYFVFFEKSFSAAELSWPYS